jgi:LacI family transcriptional regulator
VAYASIKDVAALAGVSFQTASKVLNGQTGAASAATNDRILSAASDLGYVPNALARGLVHQTSPTIGILSDDFSDVAIARFVTGAQRAVDREGLAALVVSTPPGGDHSLPLRWLHEHRVQGVLLIAPSLESDPRLAAALRDLVPMVSLSHVAGARMPVVGSDHHETGVLVADHLIGLGHRRLGTITGSRDRQVTLRRLEGFRATLRTGGVRLGPSGIVESDWSSAGARVATHRLLDADPAITAIFAQSDLMALGVLRALAQRGVSVPDDCSVVGCDDLAMAEFTSPPLTTVRVPFEETAALAADLLLRSVRGEQVSPRELVPVAFVERSSTARPPPLRNRVSMSRQRHAQPTVRVEAHHPSRGDRP